MRPDLKLWTATRSNQRRLRVFIATLVVALGVSLAYTWLRPPEYRASARLDITPGTGSLPAAPTAQPTSGDEPMRPFLTEVQVLSSRPVLEEAAQRLTSAGEDLSALGTDTVAGIQSRLQVLPVADTHVVELAATANRPALLAPLVNTVIEVYQARLADAYSTTTSESLTRADDEVKRLEQTVLAKRRDVEAFRLRNNIVSLEREENDVLSRVRNLSTSLSAANDKVAAAEGKLRALTASAEEGRSIKSRGDGAVTGLEERVSQMREEMRELERTFTPEYLAKDPKVVAQRAKLAELERQLTDARAASRQTALIDARDELAGAQATAARIRSDMASGRQEVAQFTARFNEYKALQAELEDLEKAQRDAIQRRAKLNATEQNRMPSIRVLEAATVPLAPWRPLYWRDTAIASAASLLLALLAMWLVELFNRPDPQPSVVLIQPQAGALRYEGPQLQALGDRGAQAPQLESAQPALLPRQLRFPRELSPDEASALAHAADSGPRRAILLLLSGVDPDELLALAWRDFDASRGTLRVGSAPGREITLGGPLRELLERDRTADDSEPLVAYERRRATRDSLDAEILCAAHDAALDEPAQVTAACLRHTYLAFLVRQGIRFADLTRLVGPLPAEVVGAYSALAPRGQRLGSGEAQMLHPALRGEAAQSSRSATTERY